MMLVIERLVEDSDAGVQQQMADIVKYLVDVDMADVDQRLFVQAFYDTHMHRLMQPVAVLGAQATVYESNPDTQREMVTRGIRELGFGKYA